MTPRYMNGRILLRERGGVRRYAAELADRLNDCQVLGPKAADHPWSGRCWEQLTLARRSADGVLLNVAHSGPLLHRRHVFVVHDLLALTAAKSVNPAYAALLRMQLPRLIASAKKVVAVSRAVATEVASVFDVSADRMTVAPPGVADVFGPGDSAAARSDLALDVDRPVVAALLDPTPRKNSEQVVKLLIEVQRERPDVQVVVAGGGPVPAFATMAQTAQMTPAVGPGKYTTLGFVNLGPVGDTRLATMYRAADIFVSLSAGEGFGLPVVEAAVSGAAVVSTSVPSLVEHAPGGAIVVDDATDAYRHVVALLDDAPRRYDLAERAADQLNNLRWDRTAASLEHVLGEVGQQ